MGFGRFLYDLYLRLLPPIDHVASCLQLSLSKCVPPFLHRPASLLNDHCYLPPSQVTPSQITSSQVTPSSPGTNHTVPMETGDVKGEAGVVGNGVTPKFPAVKSESMEIELQGAHRGANIVDHRRCALCSVIGDAPCSVSGWPL